MSYLLLKIFDFRQRRLSVDKNDAHFVPLEAREWTELIFCLNYFSLTIVNFWIRLPLSTSPV
jgi:hypothetical protein